MRLVTRAQWGARAYRKPSGGITYSRTRRGVKVHYLGTAYSDRAHDRCDDYVRQLQAQHMDGNGWSDIGYSFVVCTHGYVYEGRGLKRRNSANGNTSLNEQDYAVCALLGSSGLTKPPDAQLHGLRDAVEHCRENGPAGDWLGGHRDGHATACPGDTLYDWVKRGAPRPASKPPTPPTASTYKVQDGDTLSSIGRKLGVDWKLIAAANDLSEPYLIHVGDQLVIPAPARPTVDLSRLVAAAKADPPKAGTPVSYYGVKTVEAALVAEGLLERSLADGHFGTATISAYAGWQRRCGYSGSAADGIPGKDSLTRLGREHGFTVKD